MNFKPKGAHPSGRPIIERRIVSPGWARVPRDEPLTPGLRKQRTDTYAVGFTAHFGGEEDCE